MPADRRPGPGGVLVGWRRRAAVGLGGLCLALSLAGCTSGTAVESTSQQLYFQVPGGWKVYEQSQLQGGALVPALAGGAPAEFLSVAVGGAHPRASEALSASTVPWAIAEVRALAPAEQANMSFEGLSDVLFNVDAAAQMGTNVQFTSPPQLLVNGALRGAQLSVDYGGNLRYDQVAWVNPATDKVWVLMVGCSLSCFQANQAVVGSIVRSFYVRESQ